MKPLSKISQRLTRYMVQAPHRLAGERERGDVPGWVLITLMTAGLVTALWRFAEPQLTKIFTDAINSVHK
ncbi:MAG: hypothetical protein M3Y49_19100 [Actinomycetota bacterium]|nr:hypothetical protein [Actinomycetota bacterium]